MKTQNAILFCIFLMTAWVNSCSYNMSQQPRYNPASPSRFFSDHRSDRPVPDGTVAQRVNGQNAAHLDRDPGSEMNPVPVSRESLQRGRERFDIFCSPCHSRLGNGQGMVVQRGFSQPPSYHIDRLRQAPDGHFFAVMTEGFGRMWSYAGRIEAADRWAIASYIRALQLSQAATTADVPETELQKMGTAR